MEFNLPASKVMTRGLTDNLKDYEKFMATYATLIMPPTLKTLKGHIALGLSARPSEKN